MDWNLFEASVKILEYLDSCPDCKSSTIRVIGIPGSEGLELQCENCTRQWVDGDRISCTEICQFLRQEGMEACAKYLESLTAQAYLNFVRQYLNVSPIFN